ncbi:MAG: Protein kinase [Myxococcales bacterium]|nr:Protein kinase [Myxococcales bacterium]
MMMGVEPQRLGRYEILRPLARGGMAELFLARATGIQGFEKLVVVKRILPALSRDAEYVEMFLDEARLAAGLHHSNIVQVYDIGEADGTPFFAMEYLHGEDVRAILQAALVARQRPPLEHALSVAIGVAAGLHYAHELRDGEGKPLGIVHRDVSPHNVAVTFDGGVKLLDFGVAKTRRRQSATRHGTLKGKLGYMSPEQCRGDELDRRSDVFAVAILLWELVTGRRLFGGRSDFGVMKSIVEIDAPRPSVLWRDCPPALEALVMRGLRREREGRFSTAEELQLALEAFARAERLAVSGVGLGHWVKELFGERAVRPPEVDRTTTLYDLIVADDDGSAATVVDGVVTAQPAAAVGASKSAEAAESAESSRASGSISTDSSLAPVRQTRAVARRRRPRWLPFALGAALAIAAAAGWRVVAMVRQPRPAPATVVTPLPQNRPPSPITPARTIEPPSVDVELERPLPLPLREEPLLHAATRNPKRPRPAHHAPTRADHPVRPAEPARIDLDAPLPPR